MLHIFIADYYFYFVKYLSGATRHTRHITSSLGVYFASSINLKQKASRISPSLIWTFRSEPDRYKHKTFGEVDN